METRKTATVAPHKTFIATVILFGIMSLLGGCANNQPPQTEDMLSEALKLAAVSEEVSKDVTLELKSAREGDTVTVQISLNNPSQKPITSVESWLSYDPSALEGVSVSDEDSAFEFTAPYENTFDAHTGIVKVGRSHRDPVNAANIKVAEVTFKVLQEGTTFVDVYNYKNDLSGNASVNVITEDRPFNVMQKPETPALVIQ